MKTITTYAKHRQTALKKRNTLKLKLTYRQASILAKVLKHNPIYLRPAMVILSTHTNLLFQEKSYLLQKKKL